ncbi:FkbM family methyltransferase [Fulvivirga sediminis]|uniref:FkbM family methyltransferase n=1 Tax=Fulvivirga sediminis TaxID=2803949 RepID=A0A937F2A8_9BACT|nr:FkbM family methyltransferase [Fulvivirga sediminis]MBL3654981.1 FkbM family methyltransferase [Fulvivirga sediminis]
MNLIDLVRRVLVKILRIDKDFFLREELKEYKVDSEKFCWNDIPIYLRNSGSDYRVFKQVLIDEEYSFFNHLINYYLNGSVKNLVDAGANIGLTSLYFLRKYPHVQLMLIEMDSKNLQVLKRNLTGFSDHIVVNKALWIHSNGVVIDRTFRDGQSWSLSAKESHSDLELVESAVLLNILNDHKWHEIDVLKIDIEGAEQKIIIEEPSFINVIDKTKLLCIEIHDEVASRIQICDFLSKAGFQLYSKGETVFGVNKKLCEFQ